MNISWSFFPVNSRNDSSHSAGTARESKERMCWKLLHLAGVYGEVAAIGLRDSAHETSLPQDAHSITPSGIICPFSLPLNIVGLPCNHPLLSYYSLTPVSPARLRVPKSGDRCVELCVPGPQGVPDAHLLHSAKQPVSERPGAVPQAAQCVRTGNTAQSRRVRELPGGQPARGPVPPAPRNCNQSSRRKKQGLCQASQKRCVPRLWKLLTFPLQSFSVS